MWRRQFGYRRGVLGGGNRSCWYVSETIQRERERERHTWPASRAPPEGSAHVSSFQDSAKGFF
jgi:hypothetical protein